MFRCSLAVPCANWSIPLPQSPFVHCPRSLDGSLCNRPWVCVVGHVLAEKAEHRNTRLSSLIRPSRIAEPNPLDSVSVPNPNSTNVASGSDRESKAIQRVANNSALCQATSLGSLYGVYPLGPPGARYGIGRGAFTHTNIYFEQIQAHSRWWIS